MFIERTHTRTRIHTYIIEIYLDKSKKEEEEERKSIVHDYWFVDLSLRKAKNLMKMNSIDLMVLTMVEDFVKHSMMHLNTKENYLNFVIMDVMVKVISDLMIMNDDDDENLLEQDELLLDVLVHVLQLFVVAISFDDFETMSRISFRKIFICSCVWGRWSYFNLCIGHF